MASLLQQLQLSVKKAPSADSLMLPNPAISGNQRKVGRGGSSTLPRVSSAGPNRNDLPGLSDSTRDVDGSELAAMDKLKALQQSLRECRMCLKVLGFDSKGIYIYISCIGNNSSIFTRSYIGGVCMHTLLIRYGKLYYLLF